ncbi:MAG: glycosyltransferase family 2 protein [Actinobacteria bacterium]|nr:glycosyltransferase family 2 protein [Actinomycetota bacterium]
MTVPNDPSSFRYSIVIPVYNSEQIVASTIDRVVETFTAAGFDFELICVNDGSPDGSWQVISERAEATPGVLALDLMKNYGQHYANLAGLIEATGDYVITMDDDLQNPPDQALVLIEAAVSGGHEVVFGQFEQKQAAGPRRLGSILIGRLNRRVFGQPPDLVVSNFRILRRDVVDRIVASRTAYPYITGQALMLSNDRANVMVRHDPRPVGKSNYNLVRILRLVLTILFSYSSWPLRAAALLGFAVSGLSFLLGGFLVVRALVADTSVPGWTSIMVLLSVFFGVMIALLSMIGEYVVRTLTTVSSEASFHVVRRVGR